MDGDANPTDDGPPVTVDDDSLAEGWRVWSDADNRLVLAYRPDVFDGDEYPPACLPTIYVTHGRRSKRPGTPRNPAPGDPWVLTLFLEPDVKRDPEFFDGREDAIERARTLAAEFAAGEVDYRALYQVPRETYFEALDELTGRTD
ncbi:DUF5820 family protein [Halomarina oriensis]|uniref:Uncharacterized protein n=1 Tax=Halomarina oriensis TaxID=671145 RepID=A0A6B0GSN8_9EURY|nr:DUF5820 family protein [Halomarina oriensis]MWG36719.1 hypothetical protein [Halomarina oriensis]